MTPNKILIVDDSKLGHKMFEILLRQFVLVHALSGREASQALAHDSDIDLILLDIAMPGETSLDFLSGVKQDPGLRGIPVVIVALEGREEAARRALQAGAAAHIKKPIRSQELLEVIQSL